MHLAWNLVLVELNPVVGNGSDALAGGADNVHHVVGRFLFGGVGAEPRPEEPDGVAPETRQARIQHQRHQGHNCLPVWPGKGERDNNAD